MGDRWAAPGVQVSRARSWWPLERVPGLSMGSLHPFTCAWFHNSCGAKRNCGNLRAFCANSSGLGAIWQGILVIKGETSGKCQLSTGRRSNDPGCQGTSGGALEPTNMAIRITLPPQQFPPSFSTCSLTTSPPLSARADSFSLTVRNPQTVMPGSGYGYGRVEAMRSAMSLTPMASTPSASG